MSNKHFLGKVKTNINLTNINPGDVLEFTYVPTGKDYDVLVIDPETSAVTNNSQGRLGKLHAIKLKKDFDFLSLMKELIQKDPISIREKFETSEFTADGERNYRTFNRDNSSLINIKKVTVGQLVDVFTTRRLVVESSVLYGMRHGDLIYVRNDDLGKLIDDVVRLGKNTFYEGPLGHEEPVQYILNYFLGEENYKSETWEPTELENEEVLELFGGSGEAIVDVINSMVEDGSYKLQNKKVIDILVETSGVNPSNTKNWWSKKRISTQTIRFLASSGNINTSVLDDTVQNIEEFSNKFLPFQENAQKIAFADDYRRKKQSLAVDELDWDGEFVASTNLEKIQMQANLDRDKNLLHLMRTRPGVYFAGEGHINLIQTLIQNGE